MKCIDYLELLVNMSKLDFKPDNPFEECLELIKTLQKQNEDLKKKIDKRITVLKELKSEFRAIGENVDMYDVAIANLEMLKEE